MKLLACATLLLICVLTTSCDAIKGFLAQPTQPLPDLAILNVSYGTEPYGCTTKQTHTVLRVAIRNEGKGDAGPFNVEADGEVQAVSQGLAAGQDLYLTFTDAKEYQHTVIVDKENTVQESDETNNSVVNLQVPVLTLPPDCTPTPSGTS